MSLKKVEFQTTKCPDCGHWQSKIYKTRFMKTLSETIRFHSCCGCGLKFTSVQPFIGMDFPKQIKGACHLAK